MTRSLLVALAAAALLLAAPPALAKEITGFTVCGASGCRDVTKGFPGEDVVFGGSAPVDPPARAAWYSIRATIDTGGGETMGSRMAYVPARRMLRLPGENPGELAWFDMSDAQVRAYERLVRGVRPYPAARLRLGDAPTVAAPAVTPPAPAATTSQPVSREAAGGGDTTGWWIAGAALAVLLAAGAWRRTRRST